MLFIDQLVFHSNFCVVFAEKAQNIMTLWHFKSFQGDKKSYSYSKSLHPKT